VKVRTFLAPLFLVILRPRSFFQFWTKASFESSPGMNGSRCFTHSWSSPFQPSVPAHILVFGYTGFQTCKNHSCTSQASKNNSCSALIKVFHITGITININIQFTSHCPAMK
jgi:hypothetical protein